jgi:hypothetical protein
LAERELALRGIDVLDLHFRILSKPNYSAFIVPHALTLGQDYAFIYPLLVQGENKYVPRLAERLKMETEPHASRTLIKALWYAATPEALRVLKTVASDSSLSPGVREDAAERVRHTMSIRSLSAISPTILRFRFYAGFTSSFGEANLRAKRRARIRSISDEALIDLEAYTPLLYRSFK